MYVNMIWKRIKMINKMNIKCITIIMHYSYEKYIIIIIIITTTIIKISVKKVYLYYKWIYLFCIIFCYTYLF